jgi:hypothetical protein
VDYQEGQPIATGTVLENLTARSRELALAQEGGLPLKGRLTTDTHCLALCDSHDMNLLAIPFFEISKARLPLVIADNRHLT